MSLRALLGRVIGRVSLMNRSMYAPTICADAAVAGSPLAVPRNSRPPVVTSGGERMAGAGRVASGRTYAAPTRTRFVELHAIRPERRQQETA